jgi:hypothetical protein
LNNFNTYTDIDSISEVFLGSFQMLLTQLIIWVPKLIIALLLWWLGNLLLRVVAKGLRIIDIPGMDLDNRLIGKFNTILLFLGKFLLALIILDYLGIGEVVIGAIAGGLTLTIALILGISFGQSFKPTTDRIVEQLIRKVQGGKRLR